MQKHPFTRNARIYASSSSGVEVFSGLLQDSNLAVAIKETQQPTIEDANSAIQEAMTQRGLSHSAICQVYYCFLEQSGNAFKTVLLVELMDSDLAKEVERRAGTGDHWQEAELMGCLRTTVGALSYAQQRGVSHRDIKPQNIFITQGNVKIGDFGSSHEAYGGSTFLTKTLQGSPLFLSPELKTKYANLLQGLPANDPYDPYRSDVYSLGMTMAHLARLQPPVEMLNLANLQQGTALVCGEVQRVYPELGPWVTMMLNSDPGRVNFVDLEQLLIAQSSSVPVAQSSPAGYGQNTQTPSPYQLMPSASVPLQPSPFPFLAAFPVPMPAFTAPMFPLAFTSAPTWSGGSCYPYAAPSAHVVSHHCSFRYCLVCGNQVLPTSGQKNYCSKKCSKKGPLLCKACNRQHVKTLAWLGNIPASYRPFKDQCYRFCCLDCFKSSFPNMKCNTCGHWVPSYVQSRSGAYYCMDCSKQYRAARGI